MDRRGNRLSERGHRRARGGQHGGYERSHWRARGGHGDESRSCAEADACHPGYDASLYPELEPKADSVDLQTVAVRREFNQLFLGNGDRVCPVRRPDEGGSLAVEHVNLLVNHFRFTFNPETTIRQYAVDIKPEETVRRRHSARLSKATLSQIKQKLFSDNHMQFPLSKTAYDGEKNIFSGIQLPCGTYNVKMRSGEDSEDSSFQCSITLVNEFNLPELKDYLARNLMSIPRDILQGMDLVMKENPARHMMSVGRRCYPLEYRKEDDLKDVSRNFGIEVDMNMTEVVGRVIGPPELKLATPDGETTKIEVDRVKCQWNMMGKAVVEQWGIVDFSASDQNRWLNREPFIQKLISKCRNLGIRMEKPLFYQAAAMSMLFDVATLTELLEDVKRRHRPQFLLCVLSGTNDGYKNLIWICDTLVGLVTLCCLSANANNAKDQYLANLVLKINVKLGDGLYHEAALEHSPSSNEEQFYELHPDVENTMFFI